MSEPRFYKQKSNHIKSELWLVMDRSMQMDVFHWHGRTGKEKCEAVAKALNELDHGEE